MQQDLERYALVIASKKTGKVKKFVHGYMKSMLKIWAMRFLKPSENAVLVCCTDGHIEARFSGNKNRWTHPEDLSDQSLYVDEVLLIAILESDDYHVEDL